MQALKTQLKNGKRVFVLIGETGSGKSEIAVNWALHLVKTGKQVRFFDMDQTKPVFRSREVRELLQGSGVLMDDSCQCLDSPTIPAAVFDRIQEPDRITILDVGGNAAGARMLAQLTGAWGSWTAAYLVINCYRPFSGSNGDRVKLLESIAQAARLEMVEIISNPNFGGATTLADVVEGHNELNKVLVGTKLENKLLAVPRKYVQEVQALYPQIEVFGITRYIRAPWEISRGMQEEVHHGQN